MLKVLSIAFAVALLSINVFAEPKIEVVDLKATDGVVLKATFYSAAAPGPGVLLLHQCNRDRKSWDGLARALAAGGVNVLALDYRGFGESGGPRPETLTSSERQEVVNKYWGGDVDVAFQYLVSRPGVQRDRLGAGGASCGVNQSIQLARRNAAVKSLVLLSGVTDRAGRKFLHQTHIPILASAADDDGIVGMMQWITAPAPNAANRLIRLAAGGHGVEMFQPHPDLIGAIVDWYRATLSGSKTRSSATVANSMSGTRPAPNAFYAAFDEPNGTARAKKMFDEAHARGTLPQGYDEAIVNLLAYERMSDKEFDAAIDIANMNVIAFPKSANAFDSLADAYLAAGKKDLARENAQKALDLLAADTTMTADQRKLIKDSAEAKLKPQQ